jgi:hypothetical protein
LKEDVGQLVMELETEGEEGEGLGEGNDEAGGRDGGEEEGNRRGASGAWDDKVSSEGGIGWFVIEHSANAVLRVCVTHKNIC